ncbi:MAG: cation diffusion facilitator family transporter [Polyangiaceae bacterium]
MKRETRAIQVAIACSVLGAATKLTVGFITGSMSMITSAVDSLGDLFISVVNLFVIRVAAEAPDEEHNYGHHKIEGLGAMFEGGFIFAAACFIIYEAIHKITVGEVSHDSVLGIVVMLPILAMTFGTVTFLRKVAKETGSLVVKADALHYMTDVWVNVGVLVSLLLVKLTGKPIVDSIISIGIALYMIYSSIHVLKEGFGLVMDKSLEPDVVKKLTSVLTECRQIQGFHELKTRAGRIPYVDFHIEVRPDMTAKEIHDLYLVLRGKMREIAGEETMVLMHTDPTGIEEKAPSPPLEVT